MWAMTEGELQLSKARSERTNCLLNLRIHREGDENYQSKEAIIKHCELGVILSLHFWLNFYEF